MANLARAPEDPTPSQHPPPAAPAQRVTLSRARGLVGNVVQRARRCCVCRQPVVSSVTGVSAAPRAGGPRAGKAEAFPLGARGCDLRAGPAGQCGARSSADTAESQVRCSRQASGTTDRDPGSAPPVPRSQSHRAAREFFLAGQPWPGRRRQRVGNPLSEAWEDAGPQSGAPAFVRTAARDPPSACGSKGSTRSVGPG